MSSHNPIPLLLTITLLLLPTGYVGSYLALVDPLGQPIMVLNPQPIDAMDGDLKTDHYRYGGRAAAIVFWPLETIDRWLRPRTWAGMSLALPPLQSCFGEVAHSK